MPARRPMRKSSAPATPKKSIGFRPKRIWNQTEMRSMTPTGMRRQLNLETPCLRGWSGTGRESRRKPSTAAMTTM